MLRTPLTSPRNHRHAITASGAFIFGIAMTALAVQPASAASTPEDFYRPPAEFTNHPGDLLKTKPTSLLLQLPDIGPHWPGKATTVMYSSQYQDGTAAAVTGTDIEPNAAWTGKGERPTVVLGPGTIGQGDQCAPSKLMASPIGIDVTKPSLAVNYIGPEAYYLLLNGVHVFVTDYIGLGTPGIHTYANRLESAHAMLDGARAALHQAGNSTSTPIAFEGYSQGGGAAAAAAELAESYAPELNVKATYAGAPPADLSQVLPAIDGTTIAGAIGYALNGMSDRHPEVRELLEQQSNPSGLAKLRQLSTQCLAETVLTTGFAHTSNWTVTGEDLGVVLSRSPAARAILEKNRIGQLRPNAPVFLEGGAADDVIPNGQVEALAHNWQALGADVTYRKDPLPPFFPGLAANHMMPLLTTFGAGMGFILDAFNR